MARTGRPAHPEIEAARAEIRGYGIPWDAFVAYQAQWHNCRRRGVELRFTLRAWWEWWSTDGRWERRGRKGGLMMLRRGDSGHYEASNVYAGTAADNARDAWKHPTAARTAAVEKLAQRGAQALREYHSKAVVGPTGSFPTIQDAAAAAGVGRDTITRWCRRKINGWRWA